MRFNILAVFLSFVLSSVYISSSMPHQDPKAINLLAQERCKVKVTLLSVTYGGDNIGVDWFFNVRVNAAEKRIPEATAVPNTIALTFGDTVNVNNEVFNDFAGMKDKEVRVSISSKATNKSGTDERSGFHSVALEQKCPSPKVTAKLTDFVFVTAGDQIAILQLKYEIELDP